MKKVFITESQLKQVVMQEQYENFLVQQLNESLDFNAIKKKIKRALLAGVTASVILGAVSRLDINDAEKHALEQMVNTEMVQDNTEKQNDSIHQQKIEACKAGLTGNLVK